MVVLCQIIIDFERFITENKLTELFYIRASKMGIKLHTHSH